MIISTQAQFPDKNKFARVLFEEGIRHLEDAHILHNARRYPAATASAMKAAELGVKTIIVLDGALGWWDKTFTTHSPLTDIKALPFFNHYIKTLGEYRLALIEEVVEMESLAPTRPGAKAYDIQREQNPEYPFLSYIIDPVTRDGAFRLDAPSSYFTEAHGRRYFNTAQDLLNAITTQYTDVAQWQLVLPKSL